MNHKIPPKGPRFGFGYAAPVKWVKEIPGCDGAFTPAAQPGSPSVEPMIELAKESPLWAQIEAYGHEVVHAAIDFERWLRKTVVEPMMTEAYETERDMQDEEA